jgi:hypothetical protein
MNPISPSNSKALTRSYILALGLVAIFTLSALFVSRYWIGQQRLDSLIVNTSGRQRMISQNLSKLALKIRIHPDSALFYDSLGKWAHILREKHDFLSQLPTNSPQINDLLMQLQPKLISITDAALGIASRIPGDSAVQNNLAVILREEGEFLAKMEVITDRYSQEAASRLNTLAQIETLMCICALVVLFLEAMLIFRPLASRIHVYEKSLVDANDSLRQTTAKLTSAYQEVALANEQLRQNTEELTTISEQLKIANQAIIRLM